MMDSNIITIAKKEFFDHVRSRKFLAILGIFLIVAVVGSINGLNQYNDTLKLYNEFQKQVSSSDHPQDIPSFVGNKPSILLVFFQISLSILLVGSILGMAMGFDLISKEKESKSLKILLSHPVYRDQVINGKALGGLAALILALAIVLTISLASLLVFGIIPNGSEIILIAIFSIISFVFISTYFSIALFTSTTSGESGTALVYTMIIYILTTALIPVLMSTPILDGITGPAPEIPKVLSERMMSFSSDSNEITISPMNSQSIELDTDFREFQREMEEYNNKQMAIVDLLYLISPNKNYEKITLAITMPQLAGLIYGSQKEVQDPVNSGFTSTSSETTIPIADILAMVGKNLIALFIFPTVFFGLAYVTFMRMDIR
jgi:ABC-2 type transport system permease protein